MCITPPRVYLLPRNSFECSRAKPGRRFSSLFCVCVCTLHTVSSRKTRPLSEIRLVTEPCIGTRCGRLARWTGFCCCCCCCYIQHSDRVHSQSHFVNTREARRPSVGGIKPSRHSPLGVALCHRFLDGKQNNNYER